MSTSSLRVLASTARRKASRQREHLDSMSRSLRETSLYLEEAARGLTIVVGPRPSLKMIAGKAVATNVASLALASLNPLLPLVVRGASNIHTLVSLARTRRVGLGEAIYLVKKSISEVLDSLD